MEVLSDKKKESVVGLSNPKKESVAGSSKPKKECNFIYGGSVGTIESRCKITGSALNAGQGEITSDYVKRYLS